MKTKYERFKDMRADRLFHCNARDRKRIKSDNRMIAKRYSPLFKALREDRRFAVCALECALTDAGYYYSARFMTSHLRAMSMHSFKQCEYIPDTLYRLTAAHSANCDANKIACYPTRADAMRQREVVMSAGKFFAACYPGASAVSVQNLAETYQAAITPPTIFFAEDANEWARVYAECRGFGSCMDGKHFDADHPRHPVRAYVYEGNDLRLAYLTHNKLPGGETVARAIVNDDRMTYVRVYGDARLKIALHAAGYRESGATLKNAKLAAATHGGSLIAPYIDGDYSSATWDGCSDFFTVNDHGPYECRETNGYASGHNLSECEECGDDYNSEEEGAYSDYHSVSVCQHCAETVFVNAYVSRCQTDLVREDECVEVNGEWYADNERVLAAHNIVRTHDDELANLDDCVFLNYLGDYVLCDECVELAFPHGDDEWARECDTKTIVLHGDEKIVHEDYSGEEDEEEEEGEAA